MKKLTYLLVTMLLLVFVACDKSENPIAEESTAQLVEVSFDLNHYIPSTSSKDIQAKNSGKEESMPDCGDLSADYVVAKIDDDDPTTGATDFTLKLVTLNNSMETEVIKLLPGNYKLNSFVVYNNNGTPANTSDDTPIYASPMEGSYYQVLWDLEGVTKTFEVEKFVKSKITIDVLCYKPYDFEDFGFAWFQYAKYQVKTICFYGNICTKFFEEFHEDGSPYAGQDYDGYDFPAIFAVEVKNADGVIVNDLDINSNMEWLGVGKPLCVEYPDLVGVDEAFTFDILFYMPDGTAVNVYSGDFNDTMWSEKGNANGFGGEDGVFDFVIGNCSYDGNNTSIELPAYVPVPKSGEFKLSGSHYDGMNYLKISFQNIVGGHPSTIDNGMVLNSFCADKDHFIVPGIWYNANFYSSLELEGPMPDLYKSLEWGALNWMVNNLQGKTGEEIQAAIWHITDGDTATPFATEALTHKDFKPTVGDYAIILCDAIEGPNDNIIQLTIVSVDP